MRVLEDFGDSAMTTGLLQEELYLTTQGILSLISYVMETAVIFLPTIIAIIVLLVLQLLWLPSLLLILMNVRAITLLFL